MLYIIKLTNCLEIDIYYIVGTSKSAYRSYWCWTSRPKSSNLLKLGTKLGIKVSSMLLLNLLSSILLLSLVGKGLIAGGYYIGAIR